MASKTIKSIDRELSEWFHRISLGEIKLPRFQRFEAWDRNRIKGLLSVAVNNLPLGITLVLEVSNPQFIDRYIVTAPSGNRVYEHLLDGQQRLTAFWRMMHNNYSDDTYYVHIPSLITGRDSSGQDEISGFSVSRYIKNGQRYPLWADNPAEILSRGLIPSNLLKPGDIGNEVGIWIDSAISGEKPSRDDLEFASLFEKYYAKKERVQSIIINLREIISHYNLPFLALPADTPKEVALTVFINMNTNSKPLSIFDIIVAEIENEKGESLHDLEKNMDTKYPAIKFYGELSDLILTTSALLQEQVPNQKGMIAMSKKTVIDNWPDLERGLDKMAKFMESQGVFDQQRLPTNAILPVIAALYKFIPETGDKRGALEILLKKYVWTAFFTERYENSTASRSFQDYKYLKMLMTSGVKDDGSRVTTTDVPIFSGEYSMATVKELKTVKWPKGQNVMGRAILAISTLLGAEDFADGTRLRRDNLAKREYHHIFPDALLNEANLYSSLALNCVLITDKTNRNIGRKDPFDYLSERYSWVENSANIDHRLKTHLIPIEQLITGGYLGLSESEMKEKVTRDFDEFLGRRARLIHKAAEDLSNGLDINYSELYSWVDAKVKSEQAFRLKIKEKSIELSSRNEDDDYIDGDLILNSNDQNQEV